MDKGQCLEKSMKIRFPPHPASVPGSVGLALLRALLVLTRAPVSPLQAGAEGREGEGCGTVGLLLEHSFEIGESGNVPCLGAYLLPREVKNMSLVPPSVRHAIRLLTALPLGVCLDYSGEVGAGRARESKNSTFEYSLTCKTDPRFRKASAAFITSEQTLQTSQLWPALVATCSACIHSKVLTAVMQRSGS